MEQRGAFFAPVLRVPPTSGPRAAVAQVLFAIQQFAKARAQSWEQFLMRQRSAMSYERLSNAFPGSGGYLRR
eukprot:1085233-Pyramimonas_sp.AAC.1